MYIQLVGFLGLFSADGYEVPTLRSGLEYLILLNHPFPYPLGTKERFALRSQRVQESYMIRYLRARGRFYIITRNKCCHGLDTYYGGRGIWYQIMLLALGGGRLQPMASSSTRVSRLSRRHNSTLWLLASALPGHFGREYPQLLDAHLASRLEPACFLTRQLRSTPPPLAFREASSWPHRQQARLLARVGL